MTRRSRILLLLAGMLPSLAVHGPALHAHEQSPLIAGWSETVAFSGLGLSRKAKLDTGARTSSLHARDIQIFEKDGAQWVRFSVSFGPAGQKTFERPVHRISTVKRAGTAPEKRPVVLLDACVAGIHRRSEFNLKNREGMRYPVLIGRLFLGGNVLVDASVKNLHEGRCPVR